MPFGSFLDSFPSLLFVGAHALFLVVGIWAATSLAKAGRPFAPIIWLYVVSQVVFLAFFGGAITMKMAVLVEQTLLVVLIAMLTIRSSRVPSGR
jgi:uncharacterized membrane protein